MDRDLTRALACCGTLVVLLGGAFLLLGPGEPEAALETGAPLADPPSVVAWRARRDAASNAPGSVAPAAPDPLGSLQRADPRFQTAFAGSHSVATPEPPGPDTPTGPGPRGPDLVPGSGSGPAPASPLEAPRLDPSPPRPQTGRGPDTLAQARVLAAAERDLGRACLLAARHAGIEVDLDLGLARLDQIARDVRTRAGDRPTPRAALDALAQAIHEGAHIAYAHGKPDGIDPRNAYLPLVLSGRAGMCVSLSALYLAVGERAGIPLAFVELPGHVFVRYVGPGGPINVETTSGGGTIADDDYRRRHPFEDAARSYYLSDRPPTAVVAALLMTDALIRWSDAPARDRALEEAHRWDPEHLYVAYNLASAHLASARHAEAVPLYARFVELRPEEPAGWIGLARAAIGNDDLDAARAAIARAAALAPDAAELRLARAELAIGANRYAEVEAVFSGDRSDAALGLEGRVLRAIARSRAGDPGGALPHWRAALVLEATNLVALRGLARDLETLGRDRELELALAAVLAVAPDDVPVLVALGAARYRARDAAGAIHHFERAAALAPTSDVIANNLARAELLAGHPDRALDIATRGLRGAPTSVPLLLICGQLHLEHRRDAAAARRCFEKYKALGGTEETVLRWLERGP